MTDKLTDFDFLNSVLPTGGGGSDQRAYMEGCVNTLNKCKELLQSRSVAPTPSDEREAFETWIVNHPHHNPANVYLDSEIPAKSVGEAMWTAWQARGQSRQVVLGKPNTVAETCQHCGHVTQIGEHHSHPCSADSGHPDDGMLDALRAVCKEAELLRKVAIKAHDLIGSEHSDTDFDLDYHLASVHADLSVESRAVERALALAAKFLNRGEG